MQKGFKANVDSTNSLISQNDKQKIFLALKLVYFASVECV